MVELFRDLLEKYREDKKAESVLCFIYVGAISSDSLFDVEDCDRALNTISALEMAVKTANIDTELKDEWTEKISIARQIINRDKEMFENTKGMPLC